MMLTYDYIIYTKLLYSGNFRGLACAFKKRLLFKKISFSSFKYITCRTIYIHEQFSITVNIKNIDLQNVDIDIPWSLPVLVLLVLNS